MKTNASLHHAGRHFIRGTKPAICKRNPEITKRPSCFAWLWLTIAVLSLMPLAAIAQDHGGGEGGGGGCGDVFGDLIHILRNDAGQPILAQRWVELPAEVPGYGWGYCPIAVTGTGPDMRELGFEPYSCDIAAADVEFIEEVNYFGRLNGGRTKERNNRMHFDEVISNIKDSHMVKTDAAGRLMLGYDCMVDEENDGIVTYKAPCLEWATIDSPMEHMGIYTRTMKYGHLATDPYEVDTWAHGDPKSGTQFHVALGPEDWPKFHSSLRHLLPNNGEDLEACYEPSPETYIESDEIEGWFAGEPFFDMNGDCIRDDNEPFNDVDGDGGFDPAETIIGDNGNCVLDEFVFTCAGPEDLGNKDFISGAISLASAASKTGMITKDLIQYFNRILKVAKKTEHTVAPNNTLPALYRDCWPSEADPVLEGEGPWEEDLKYGTCEIVPAVIPLKPSDPEYCNVGPVNHCLFPDIEERFVDFGGLDDYEREADSMVLIINTSATTWEFPELNADPAIEASSSYIWQVSPGSGIDLVTWMEAVNGESYATEGIAGFRAAASDILRTIEYIHNYEVPEVLECAYNTSLCAVE
jgi:hypothetical protein